MKKLLIRPKKILVMRAPMRQPDLPFPTPAKAVLKVRRPAAEEYVRPPPLPKEAVYHMHPPAAKGEDQRKRGECAICGKPLRYAWLQVNTQNVCATHVENFYTCRLTIAPRTSHETQARQ